MTINNIGLLLLLLICVGMEGSVMMVSATVCKQSSCVGYNTLCTEDIYGRKPSNAPSTSSSIVCASSTYCGNNPNYNSSNPSSLKTMCYDLKKIGDSCVDLTECPYGASCIANSQLVQVCTYTQYANLGESCSVNSDCSSNLLCTSDKCVVDISPIEIQNGVACKFQQHCPFGTYCNVANNKCVKEVAYGQQCSSNFQCVGNGYCVGGACVPKYSLNSGQACQSDDMCNTYQSSYCDLTTSTCSPITYATPTAVNCSRTGVTCSKSEACYCGGDKVTGSCFSVVPNGLEEKNQCQAADQLFQDCLAANQVVLADTYSVPTSLAVMSCKKEYCRVRRWCTAPNPSQCFTDMGDFSFCAGILPPPSEDNPISSSPSVLSSFVILSTLLLVSLLFI